MTKAEDRLTIAIQRGLRSAQALYSRPQLVAFLQAGLSHGSHFTVAQRVRLEASIRQGYRYALLSGARRADLPATVQKVDATVDARLDVTNPSAIRWVERHAAELVDLLDVTQQQAVAAIVRRMFTDGVPPNRAARLIFEVIGLDSRSANAVANFEAGLQGEDRAPEQVQRLVATYGDRLRRYRARMIARTEAVKGSVEGQKQLWQLAVERGILEPGRTKRQWLVAADERLCPVCAPIPSGGPVSLDQPFVAGDGSLTDGPPIHPNCRCALKLVFRNADGSWPETPEPVEPYAGQSGPPRKSLKPRIPQ